MIVSLILPSIPFKSEVFIIPPTAGKTTTNQPIVHFENSKNLLEKIPQKRTIFVDKLKSQIKLSSREIFKNFIILKFNI